LIAGATIQSIQADLQGRDIILIIRCNRERESAIILLCHMTSRGVRQSRMRCELKSAEEIRRIISIKVRSKSILRSNAELVGEIRTLSRRNDNQLRLLGLREKFQLGINSDRTFDDLRIEECKQSFSHAYPTVAYWRHVFV